MLYVHKTENNFNIADGRKSFHLLRRYKTNKILSAYTLRVCVLKVWGLQSEPYVLFCFDFIAIYIPYRGDHITAERAHNTLKLIEIHMRARPIPFAKSPSICRAHLSVSNFNLLYYYTFLRSLHGAHTYTKKEDFSIDRANIINKVFEWELANFVDTIQTNIDGLL